MPSVELIAHRGASRERPENTLAAFARAIELGADAAELDVHRTADDHLVVHHDPWLASGVRPPAIASLTLAEVATFRVRGEPIPTLEEVIASSGKLRIYCELKGRRTAEPATALLSPLGDRAAVHSFDHRMVAEAQRFAPEVPRGVLESAYHRDASASMRDVAARDLWQAEQLIDVALVEAVHASGGRVIAWTVNRPERAVELASFGVDGICTDDVAGIGAALGR
jgi:glycerophosphoryl diester phosphodiesterase